MFILHTMTFYTLYNFVLGIISNKVYNLASWTSYRTVEVLIQLDV